jgi:hypothetical protein
MIAFSVAGRGDAPMRALLITIYLAVMLLLPPAGRSAEVYSAAVTTKAGQVFRVDGIYLEYEWVGVAAKAGGLQIPTLYRERRKALLFQEQGTEDILEIPFFDLQVVRQAEGKSEYEKARLPVEVTLADGQVYDAYLRVVPLDSVVSRLLPESGRTVGISNLKSVVRGQERGENGKYKRFELPVELASEIEFEVLNLGSPNQIDRLLTRMQELESERSELLDRIQYLEQQLHDYESKGVKK